MLSESKLFSCKILQCEDVYHGCFFLLLLFSKTVYELEERFSLPLCDIWLPGHLLQCYWVMITVSSDCILKQWFKEHSDKVKMCSAEAYTFCKMPLWNWNFMNVARKQGAPCTIIVQVSGFVHIIWWFCEKKIRNTSLSNSKYATEKLL
jgi:hypothetical protein